MEEQTVNNQVQQPNIPTPPAPKHQTFLTSKLFLITLAIVVLFTAVYAGIYLYLNSQLDQISKPNQTATVQPSPTPTPIVIPTTDPSITANWKTYTNTDYGYQLQYPPTWKIEIPSNTSGIGKPTRFVTMVSDIRIQHEKTGNPPYSIGIVVYDNSENKSIEEIDKQGVSSSSIQGKTINSMKAYFFTNLTQQFDDLSFYTHRVYLKDNDKNFISISLYPFNPNKPLINQESIYKIFNQILSTFRFD